MLTNMMIPPSSSSSSIGQHQLTILSPTTITMNSFTDSLRIKATARCVSATPSVAVARLPSLPATCAVCGDRSSGFHYSVTSCNGCKTFFRRTVIHRRRFVCARGGACTFDKEMRCACRACRFRKCLECGMDPRSVQVHPENAGGPVGDADYLPVEFKPRVPPLRLSADAEFAGVLQDLIVREERLGQLRERACWYSAATRLRDILEQPCIFGDHAGIRKSMIDDEYNTLHYKRNPLGYWMLSELFLQIEYSRSFLGGSACAALSSQDIYCLTRSSAPQLTLFALASYCMERRSESTIFPDGTTAAVECEAYRARGGNPLWDNIYAPLHLKPTGTLRDLKPSRVHVALLKAILIFNPDVPGLSPLAARFVTERRESYLRLLSKLILGESGAIGPTRLQELLFTLKVMFDCITRVHDFMAICALDERFAREMHPLSLDMIDAVPAAALNLCVDASRDDHMISPGFFRRCHSTSTNSSSSISDSPPHLPTDLTGGDGDKMMMTTKIESEEDDFKVTKEEPIFNFSDDLYYHCN